MKMTVLPQNLVPNDGKKELVYGAVVGLLYGVGIRMVLQFFPGNKSALLMTLGFVFFMPLVMGFVTVFVAERKQSRGAATWLLLPWASVAGALLVTMVLAWEGFICVLMFAPIALVLGSIGGVIAGLVARSMK